MMDKIRAQLTSIERTLMASVLTIPEHLVSHTESVIAKRGQHLVIRVVSADDSRCPFKVVLIRDPQGGRITLSVGSGAEFLDCEPYGSAEDLKELSDDLSRFLRSRVHCVFYEVDGRVRKAVYTPHLLVAGEVQITLTYRTGYIWPFTKHKKSEREYQAWISDAASDSANG